MDFHNSIFIGRASAILFSFFGKLIFSRHLLFSEPLKPESRRFYSQPRAGQDRFCPVKNTSCSFFTLIEIQLVIEVLLKNAFLLFFLPFYTFFSLII
jgi:hypothetical protein